MPTVFGAGVDFLDITDYIFLEDDAEAEPADPLGSLPEGLGPDCTGIVLHSSSPSLNPSASPEACCATCLRSLCNLESSRIGTVIPFLNFLDAKIALHILVAYWLRSQQCVQRSSLLHAYPAG